jgi:CheY-like chemotaxis protein
MPCVLIIDDDESLRKMLRFRLKDSFEVLDTSSPEDGLMLALRHKPDVILVDLMMPTHTGLEACQTIAALSFTELIPVFVISGHPKHCIGTSAIRSAQRLILRSQLISICCRGAWRTS